MNDPLIFQQKRQYQLTPHGEPIFHLKTEYAQNSVSQPFKVCRASECKIVGKSLKFCTKFNFKHKLSILFWEHFKTAWGELVIPGAVLGATVPETLNGF